MSTWGGIGEGIAQGLKERMDREDQERRERTAQFNADRQFRFAQEQAERAQANADRTFEAGREDAAKAQSNSERDFGLRSRTADLDASLKKQDMELRGRLGDLDAQMKREELEGRREDRAFSREKMSNDLQMQRERLAGEKEDRALRGELGRAELEGKKEDRKLRREESEERRKGNAEDRAFRREEAKRNQGNIEADRQFKREEGAADRKLRQQQIDETAFQNDREYELRREAQDWNSKINAERMRQFQLANEKMDAELREQRNRERLAQETAADQWVFATARMLEGTSGEEKEWNIQSDQGPVMAKGRLVEGNEFYRMFGKDSDLVRQGYYGIAMTEDENGKPEFTLLNNDPKMNITKNEDAMYEAYNDRYKGLGDKYFKKAKQEQDLGVLAQTKKIETDEGIRRDKAKAMAETEAYNLRNHNGSGSGYAFGERLALQLARNPDKAEEIAEYLGVSQDALIEIFRNTLGAYGGGTGGSGRRVNLPPSAYRMTGQGRYRDGAIQLKSGERVEKGKSLKTPAGTVVNEGDGNVYIIPVSE